jgi:hypothetical protein
MAKKLIIGIGLVFQIVILITHLVYAQNPFIELKQICLQYGVKFEGRKPYIYAYRENFGQKIEIILSDNQQTLGVTREEKETGDKGILVAINFERGQSGTYGFTRERKGIIVSEIVLQYANAVEFANGMLDFWDLLGK